MESKQDAVSESREPSEIVLRMTLTEDYLERDEPGMPRRKTVGLSLATASDENDDNDEVRASSVQLKIHGCQRPGWFPFVEGGDFHVTITRATPLEAKREGNAP